MNSLLRLSALALMVSLYPVAMGKTYLFVLSGQSNMAKLDPELGFTPMVTEALAPDEVIVVKVAVGGQPIMRWDKQWEPGTGQWPQEETNRGTLYEKLMKSVKEAIAGKTIDCVTFVWMQGESDASKGHVDVYEASFKRVVKQLEDDLGITDFNVVIGRINDHRNKNETQNKGWDDMRALQVAMAEANPHWEWVDTDALNGPKDDVHMIGENGYKILGELFAEKALALVKEYCR